ncbi:MAG: 3-dehydroquinate synthase II [Candidatus Undinarchaeales archaeon]|jgi:3-dehydroquinate synthase II|nr:3-dehydroquinate synthase II [Candidatus Undinarchaeales archaeon]MDP7493990.1 3-dehydroquinate synthase II [Candidatus Undinarchaeales archaeon]
MKELWALLQPDEAWVRTVRELGVTTFLALGEDVKWALEHREALGITVAAPDPEADLIVTTDPAKAAGGVLYVKLSSAEELKMLESCEASTVIVEASDWRIIPLENIIASSLRVLGVVSDVEEARLFATILEKGVDGLVVRDDIEAVRDMLSEQARHIELEPVEISEVREIGEGDRVCIDTCSILEPGEGALVGNQGACLFLVHAENVENPYIATRPFRVNAGPVHEYVLVGDRTRYLSELEAGEPLLVVRTDGATRIVTVGRAKIERRPLVLVVAKMGDIPAKTVLQNAETVRLVRPDGSLVPVTELKAGDEVLAYREAPKGRHFGMAVEETIVER